MMTQLKVVLKRLKQPSVLLSLVSQVVTLLILINVDINKEIVMSAATVICSILVTLGIISNPDSRKKGYGDDCLNCKNCGTANIHTKVAGRIVCTRCGAVYNPRK